MGRYLTPEGIAELKRHKYSSGGYTPLDLLMNHFWIWLEACVPRCIHPNVLTLSGCIVAIFASIGVLLFAFPTLKESAPSWVYFLSAASFFIYQTFDALDGKHARRLGLSSPLGQLMDHGCDILSTTPQALLGAAIIRTGVTIPQYVAVVISSQCLQYLYLWWELHFHVFFCSTGVIGVTEAQFVMIALSLVGGIMGPDIFIADLSSTIPVSISQWLRIPFDSFGVEYTLSSIFQLFLIACNGILCIYNIVTCIKKAKGKRMQAIAQLLVFIIYIFCQGFVFLQGIWLGISPAIIIFLVCSIYSIYLLRLCLSATCRLAFTIFQWPAGLMVVLASILYFQPVDITTISWLFLAISIINFALLMQLVVTSVSDICNALGISCFIVPKESKKKHN